jgi:ABC-type glycerol-3-phosphate transport system permease component
VVASATAFVLGFGVANYGILRVPGRDRWLWFAVAIVLMLTSVVGVLMADSRRRVSMWAVLGLEVLFVFTFLPLLWTFTLATSSDPATSQSLLPQEIQWSVFRDVFGSGSIRQVAATSALVGLIATVVSMLLAVPAAYALVRRQVRFRRVVYFFVLAVLLAPLVALAGPLGDQLRAFGVFGSRFVLVIPTLLITLPLALWLCVTLMRDLPWTLRDSVRADGATRGQTFRAFVVPMVLPALITVGLLTFIAACNDAVIGATLTAGDESRTLPATLLLAADQLDQPSAAVAAAGLLWLVPAVLVLLALPRRTIRLLGRTY